MRREKFCFTNNLRAGNAQALEVPAFAGMTLVAASPFYRKRFAVLWLCLAASFDAV